MYRNSALESYSRVDIETKTTIDNPHHMISLLFEKGCVLSAVVCDSEEAMQPHRIGAERLHEVEVAPEERRPLSLVWVGLVV